MLITGLALSAATAQQPSGSQQPSQSQQNQGQSQQNKPNSTPEAGGPQGDIGPIAVPKKKEDEPKKEPRPQGPKKIEGMPETSIHVNVPLVTLDVGVLSRDGMFIPGLKKENFRVLEDGVPQTITSFGQIQAPITAVILVEFASNFYPFQIDSLRAAYTFTNTLTKNDWVALISYDIKEHILQDFTQDKNAIFGGLNSLRIAMSSETNLFDALYDTVDRLETIEGRKYIILISTGKDTFSKKTLDHVLKKIQASKDIVIYAISTGQAIRTWAEAHGMMGAFCGITSFNCNIEYLQADNQMKSFAKMTGGKAYLPIFPAQFNEAFTDIGQTIRNEYAISYHSTNRAQDGSYRKIKVELVDETGHALRIRDQHQKDVKYSVLARDGYKAKQEVE
ncbi:MAG TPA: VWA domain-containing protein [Candidatus Angelobacter sp.]|jgi:VWFA-related protein|nr:VWA domain-containing protein [Candidatus Angelobacter sp.]